MKKVILLVLSLIIGESAVAQKGQKTVGLQLGSFLWAGAFHKGIEGTGGVYFDYTLSRRLGFRTAVLYGLQKGDGYLTNCSGVCTDFPTPITYQLHFIDVPVNMAVNLNRRENTSWKTNFLLGYTGSYLISYKYWTVSNEKKPESFEKYSSPRTRHYLNLGLEVSHNLSAKYNLAFGPGLRIGLGESFPMTFLLFNLKVGRNLNVKK